MTFVLCKLERDGPFDGMLLKWLSPNGLNPRKPPIHRPNQPRRKWSWMGIKSDEFKHMRLRDWPKASVPKCLKVHKPECTRMRILKSVFIFE